MHSKRNDTFIFTSPPQPINPINKVALNVYLEAQRVERLIGAGVREDSHHVEVFEPAVSPTANGLVHLLHRLKVAKFNQIHNEGYVLSQQDTSFYPFLLL